MITYNNYKGIKSKEIIWVTYFTIEEVPAYCITSDLHRDMYYLYELDKTNSWVKTKYKSDNPLDFTKYIQSIFNGCKESKKNNKGKLF